MSNVDVYMKRPFISEIEVSRRAGSVAPAVPVPSMNMYYALYIIPGVSMLGWYACSRVAFNALGFESDASKQSTIIHHVDNAIFLLGSAGSVCLTFGVIQLRCMLAQMRGLE